MNNTLNILNNFGKQTVVLGKRNLNLSGAYRKGNRKVNASNDLSNGLGYDIIQEQGRYIIEFTSKQNYAGDVEKGRRKGIMPPSRALEKYIKSKKLRLRKTVDNNGQKISKFVSKTPKNIKSAAFAMALSIKKKGIKPAPFFSDAMEEAYKKNEEAIAEAIALDFEDLIFNNFQKNGGNS